MTIEKKWWFKLGIVVLSVLSANLLCSRAGISLSGSAFFSSVNFVYIFCWLGFERLYSFNVCSLLLFLNPKLVSLR